MLTRRWISDELKLRFGVESLSSHRRRGTDGPRVNSGAHRVAGLDAQTLYNKAVAAFAQGLVEESARAIQLAQR